MGVQAFEGGQEGGVDVEVAVPPAPHEAFGVQPQDACVAEKLDLRPLQRAVECGIEVLAGGEVLVVDDEGGDARSFGAGEALGAGDVRHYEDDLRGIAGGLAGLDQRLEVGPAGRDEDANAFPRHRAPQASSPLKRMASPPPRPTSAPISLVSSPRCRSTRPTSEAATTTIMPMPQLKVRSISS